MCYIYTITSLKKYDIGNGIERLIYVGSCLDYERRFKNHKTACFYEKSTAYNSKVYRYLRQYGLDNFVFEVIEVMSDDTTDEELRIREQFYIDKFDSKNSMNSNDAVVNTREYQRVYRREWLKNNRDKHNASGREWAKNNHDRAKDIRRRATRKYRMWKNAVMELYNISCFE